MDDFGRCLRRARISAVMPMSASSISRLSSSSSSKRKSFGLMGEAAAPLAVVRRRRRAGREPQQRVGLSESEAVNVGEDSARRVNILTRRRAPAVAYWKGADSSVLVRVGGRSCLQPRARLFGKFLIFTGGAHGDVPHKRLVPRLRRASGVFRV